MKRATKLKSQRKLDAKLRADNTQQKNTEKHDFKGLKPLTDYIDEVEE